MTSISKPRQKPLLILSTASSRKEAEKISGILLKKKLIACANIIYPVTSFFWWQGKREKSREALLIIKTVASRFSEVEKYIRQYHSYTVPEIIGWTIEAGSAPYLQWLRSSVR